MASSGGVLEQRQVGRCLTYILVTSLNAMGVRSKPCLHKVICPLTCSASVDALEADEAERLRILIIGDAVGEKN